MLKYYALLFLVLGLALFWVYVKDPCHQQLRADFSNKYPSYEILNAEAAEGSPESVRCQISYRKPDGEQIYQETWVYQQSDAGWSFSNIIKTGTIDAPSS